MLYRIIALISCLTGCALAASGQTAKSFLSSLAVTKSDPLYTTYAAALERSEFTLDEGYHFVFYDSSRGADFTTDMAGDLCVAFKKGGKYVHRIDELFKQPVITTSYSDLVKYTCYPFDDIKVDATFVVHSSRAAILDLTIQNVGSRSAALQVFPFLHNTYRTFEEIEFHNKQNAISFAHEELPDSWVLEHGVPYVHKVQNVLLFSRLADRLTSFRSYAWGTVRIPQAVDITRKRVYAVWGRVTDKEGARCAGDPAEAKLMVVLNGAEGRILTESAPRWGSTDPNFNRYGMYGIELGNFPDVKDGDQYRIMIQCPGSGQVASVSGIVRGLKDTSDVRSDAVLQSPSLPRAPEGLKKGIWGSGTEVRLYWKRSAEPVTYNVYRRDYRTSGLYELIGERLQQTFFTDKNITGDRIYGYVVVAVDGQGNMGMHSEEVNNVAGSDFLTDVKYPGQIMNAVRDHGKLVSGAFSLDLTPGASSQLRIVRAVARADEDRQQLMAQAQRLLPEDLGQYLANDERLYSRIPQPAFDNPEKALLYWSAFTLMRQVMLPPEGKCGVNYYVFSREPQWGWGHGGQVFHESLTMLAYAYMDPLSAMNSQRVYMERQYKDGYINYRTGPYLDENIPHGNQLTTSAPWYAWQNWEVYRISRDRKFLADAYRSSVAFYNYYVRNRDSDGDGLCEWGGEAVLESVRDARVAVWDQVDWPSNFEAVDLNCMLVKEAKSLSAMAEELGYADEAQTWQEDAAKRSNLINQTMWDEQTGFYYCVDKKTHSFTYKKPDDLKRREIIGFLPLWAGVADRQQAGKLLETLRDTSKFWRRFGIPSLSADDPYYNPKGYWNGPVWVEWDYLVVRGLLDYGFGAESQELTDRVAANMIAQLKKDHNFWEFYSPDDQWAGYHKTYIWAGLINRMMMDAQAAGKK